VVFGVPIGNIPDTNMRPNGAKVCQKCANMCHTGAKFVQYGAIFVHCDARFVPNETTLNCILDIVDCILRTDTWLRGDGAVAIVFNCQYSILGIIAWVRWIANKKIKLTKKLEPQISQMDTDYFRQNLQDILWTGLQD
jgi:hypothetical protein